jgi:hypothetical protein
VPSQPLCWLLGTFIRKIHSFLRTDVPSSQHSDHTKEYTSRFRKGQSPPLYQVSLLNESSRFRSWAGYTRSTEEWPECFKQQAVIPEEMSSAYHGVFELPARKFRPLVFQ